MGGRDHSCPDCGRGGFNNDWPCECDDRRADNAQSVNERLYDGAGEPVWLPKRYRFKDGVWLKAADYDRVVEELKHARLEREDAIRNASLADEQVHEWYARAEAAEREIEKLSRAISAEQMLRPGTISRAQANRERDSLEKDYEPLVVRAEAAERKVERCREALREIRLIADSLPKAGRIHAITRAVLEGEKDD